MNRSHVKYAANTQSTPQPPLSLEQLVPHVKLLGQRKMGLEEEEEEGASALHKLVLLLPPQHSPKGSLTSPSVATKKAHTGKGPNPPLAREAAGNTSVRWDPKGWGGRWVPRGRPAACGPRGRTDRRTDGQLGQDLPLCRGQPKHASRPRSVEEGIWQDLTVE